MSSSLQPFSGNPFPVPPEDTPKMCDKPIHVDGGIDAATGTRTCDAFDNVTNVQ